MSQPQAISLPGGRFAYLEAGPADGPVVICLHGFPDHAPTFSHLIQRLGARGYRAVAPWLRGFFPSELVGPYHVNRLAADLLELGHALSPTRPVALVGHDWGAIACYVAAATVPHRVSAAVTLAVPHPFSFLQNPLRLGSQPFRSWYMAFFLTPLLPELALLARHGQLVDYLWHSWSPGWSAPPSHLDDVKECLAQSMPAPIEYYRAVVRPLSEAIARYRALGCTANRVTVPTLHLHGAADRCILAGTSRGEERFFAGPFERKLLPGVGHFVHLEAPDLAADLMLAWLHAHASRP
ncbi:MAG: alpha/beta hydrolase [Candidatus Schekmanbacteria bacterium]|nr:alpha/beta hydrolase [Candidatus Schekmanbacteria bacterium]